VALWAIGIRKPPDRREAPPRDVDLAIELLHHARSGAAVLINTPNVPNVHLVTGPMAYLMLSQWLDPGAHPVALASFASTHARAARDFASLDARAASQPIPSLDATELDALAAQSDAHPIKLTEAALRAFDQTDNALFLRAAGKARRLHTLRGVLGIARTMVTRRAG
jgi:hypothetical protein